MLPRVSMESSWSPCRFFVDSTESSWTPWKPMGECKVLPKLGPFKPWPKAFGRNSIVGMVTTFRLCDEKFSKSLLQLFHHFLPLLPPPLLPFPARSLLTCKFSFHYVLHSMSCI